MEIKKEQIKKLHKGLVTCPEAQEAIKEAFPECFKKEWVDISEKIKWQLRFDGVLQINYPKADDCIGHMNADGTFYWATGERESYKEEISDNGRHLKIFEKI